jgi:hypothetical protein
VNNLLVPNRDFYLAEEALDEAERQAKGKDHRILAIRGLTRFESGKQTEGMTLVRQALDLAPNDAARANWQNFLRVMDLRRQPSQQPALPQPQPQPPPQSQGASAKR